MKREAMFFVLAPMLALSACGKTITMNYRSNPDGAIVYQNGIQLGRTPLVARYKASDKFNHGGCQYILGLKAVWESGASTQASNLGVCRQNTYLQSFVINRPDVPGLEEDEQVAYQLASQREAAQQQVESSNDEAVTELAGQVGALIGQKLGSKH